MKDEVETNLTACVFIPPRAIEAQYQLFQALKVEGEKDACRAEFSLINSGLVEMLKTNEQKLAASGGFSIVEDPRIKDINGIYDSEIALSGGFGIDVQNYVKMKLEAGRSQNDNYKLDIRNMKMTKLNDQVGGFLEKHAGDFCNHSDVLRHVFTQTSEFNSNENIQYGLAFVTSVITGSINMSEAGSKSSNADATVDVPVVGGAGVEANRNSSTNVACNSFGVVGISVYFLHLVKETTGKIGIKASFPVSKSNDESLIDALDTITAKRFRNIWKFSEQKHSKCKVMFEIYDRTDFKEIRKLLIEEIVSLGMREVSGDNNNVEASLEASLSIVEHSTNDAVDANDTKNMHEQTVEGVGLCTDVYVHSNNILYESTLDDLQKISNTINGKKGAGAGAISIQGKLIDGIKPVIHCEMPDSLPIIYEKKLSGTTKSGEIPAWILRVKGCLIILVRVSGHDGSSGIVTAHNHTDWHVREFVEYVEKGDTGRIEELEGKGFFRLDPDEAADTEMNEKVKNGAFVMMGRHILALKKEAVMAAVTQDGMALQYASDEMKADKEVVFAAVTQNGMAMKYASKVKEKSLKSGDTVTTAEETVSRASVVSDDKNNRK